MDDDVLDALILALDPQTGGERTFVELLAQKVQPSLARDESTFLSPAATAQMVAWYGRPGLAAASQGAILRTLAVDGSSHALGALAELLAADPPSDDRHALPALIPLFQPRGDRLPGAAALFPRLLDALARPALAPAVLDVANFLTRRGLVDEHPAKARVGELAALVGSLAQRLAQVEAKPHEFANTPAELSKLVTDGVALLVSLCDALALAGDVSVSPKLHQVLSLAHRRVQTEAAAALAKLGDPQGLEHLKKLAAEPAARSRVLAYLDELGAAGEVEEKFRSAEARAEGELAAWMAQPTRFGVAPDELELIDRVKQYWPGYVDPVECYLFTYEYRRAGRTADGVGIVGPTTSALQFDLQDLPPADIYALYAGLDADHTEMFETPLAELSDVQRSAWDQVADDLKAHGYDEVRLFAWHAFFGEQHAVATGRRDGRQGVVVVADDAAEWIPLPPATRAFGPAEAYALYKGRKLLKAFNKRS